MAYFVSFQKIQVEHDRQCTPDKGTEPVLFIRTYTVQTHNIYILFTTSDVLKIKQQQKKLPFPCFCQLH